jgi:transketolase
MRRTSLNCVHDLAREDSRVVFVGSDLGAGVLEEMRGEIPDRWFMEGVAEQHIIGMAAGLAMEGFIPYVNTIATFLSRRCFEQIVVDLCLHRLPVRLIANGGGVVYAPLGPTHLAIEDIALMRCLPNMTVVAPCDAEEMGRLMRVTPEWPGPIYIRLAKGGDTVVSQDELGFEIGKGILLREPGRILFVSTGIMTQRALQASEQLAAESVECGVLHLHTIKPLDEDTLLSLSSSIELIVTLEEHVLTGGLGTAVIETIHQALGQKMPKVVRLGLPVEFPKKYGTQDTLLASYGLDSASIAHSAKLALQSI